MSKKFPFDAIFWDNRVRDFFPQSLVESGSGNVYKIQYLNGRCVTAMDLYDCVGIDYELKFLRRDDALRALKKLQSEYSNAGIDIPVLHIVSTNLQKSY